MQSLPYVAWVILASLAIGSFAFVAVTRERTDASRGYLGFTAFVAALLGLLTLVVDGGLEVPTSLAIESSSPLVQTFRQGALAAFSILAIAYVAALGGRLPALPIGGAAVAAGGTALVAAAVGWAPTLADSVPLGLQLGVLSLATGGSMAAIVLGHWYLVTPRLSVEPLVLQSRVLLGVIVLQMLLFVVWTTLGGGVGQDAFEAFTGGAVLLVALRLLVSLVFPLVLTYMAWRTAQTRSMESATGLLYINLAAVMAGTIGAAALYLSDGLLV
ncbi:hypothetical protein BH24CHL5_BH24CHL5_03380 [soil metagenome]